MKTLTINLPDDLDMTCNDISMLIAATLYEQAKVSLGQAAEIAGLSKRTFIELLGNYNVSVFNYPPSELSTDIANA